MRMYWVSLCLGGLLALAACKGGETGTGGSGGSPAAGGGGSGATGPGGGGGTGGAPLDCDCACGAGTMCSLVCNDPMHPSFCAGTAPVAGGMCETCLLTTCMFTADDIASLGCN